MSDIEFKGVDPKSENGKSIFFYSMDYWIELCECISMIISEAFPSYPSMDAENAEYLAGQLKRRLDFGLVQAYYELATRRRLADPEMPAQELEDETRSHVECMLDWTRQYITFLKECGGCEPQLWGVRSD